MRNCVTLKYISICGVGDNENNNDDDDDDCKRREIMKQCKEIRQQQQLQSENRLKIK